MTISPAMQRHWLRKFVLEPLPDESAVERIEALDRLVAFEHAEALAGIKEALTEALKARHC
mgnify:CR=1 FL=1